MSAHWWVASLGMVVALGAVCLERLLISAGRREEPDADSITSFNGYNVAVVLGFWCAFIATPWPWWPTIGLWLLKAAKGLVVVVVVVVVLLVLFARLVVYLVGSAAANPEFYEE